MRRDRLLLGSGYVASAGSALGAYLVGFGWILSLVAFLGSVVLTRTVVYLYFERFLAFKTFEDFKSEKIRHECIACGTSCHLRVNLGKDDVERILSYTRETGLKEIVIEKSGSRCWLKRRKTGACVFLRYSGNVPRCQIYPIRPVACRLYPLIPSGNRLKADPFCPGFSEKRGQTFKRHLITQDVVAYVKNVMGKT